MKKGAQVSRGTPSSPLKCRMKSSRTPCWLSQFTSSFLKTTVDMCVVIFQQIGLEKRHPTQIFEKNSVLKKKKKFLETHQWQEIPFKPSLKHCHVRQVTFPSTSHDLSDTGAYQQYTTGKIIGIKKANPPSCFNCQKEKKKSEVTANTFKSTTVECQFPDSATQTKTASLFTKNLPRPVFRA